MVDQTLVDEFSKKLSSNDYMGALQVLANADKDTRSYIVGYLKSNTGVDPVEAIIHNAILETGEPSKVVTIASKLGYRDYTEKEVKAYRYSKAIEELEACSERKDWGCADKVIEEYHDLGGKQLAEAYLYLVSKKITGNDLGKLNDFAKRHGLEGLYEIVNGVLTVDTSGLSKEVTDELSRELMQDITRALQSGDVKGVIDKYGDLLSKITVKGKTLLDIVKAIPTVKLLSEYTSKLGKEETWIQDSLTKALTGKGKPDMHRVDVDISLANDTLSILNTLKNMNGILVEDMGKARDGINELLARLYLLKGAGFYLDKNYSKGDEYFKKALTIDNNLSQAVTVFKLLRPATMDEIACILSYAGLTSGSKPTFHIRTYGTSTVGSRGVYAI